MALWSCTCSSREVSHVTWWISSRTPSNLGTLKNAIIILHRQSLYSFLIRRSLAESQILDFVIYTPLLTLQHALYMFYLFLHLYVDFICIDEGFEGIYRFSLCYRVGRVRFTSYLLHLGNLSSFIGFAYAYNVDYESLFLRYT
jgi:hypothetical protein